MPRVMIDGLTLQEWTAYWESGNIPSGDPDVDPDIMKEFTAAAEIMSLMMRLVDGVTVKWNSPPVHGDVRFSDIDGKNWFDVRKTLTGKESQS